MVIYGILKTKETIAICNIIIEISTGRQFRYFKEYESNSV